MQMTDRDWVRIKHVEAIMESVARETQQIVNGGLRFYMLDADNTVTVAGRKYPLKTSELPANDTAIRHLFKGILHRSTHVTCLITTDAIYWVDGVRRVVRPAPSGRGNVEIWQECYNAKTEAR